MDLVILLDCFEDLLRKRCMRQPRANSDMENEIAKFKESGLSVVRHYDLQEKLAIVSCVRVEITNKIIIILNKERCTFTLYEVYPKSKFPSSVKSSAFKL